MSEHPEDRPIRIDSNVRSGRVVYGVTVGISALQLLRGQLAWLCDHGWDVDLVANPDEAARSAVAREGVAFYPIPMQRSISPFADGTALWQWIKLLGRLKPDAVNVSTPKAGLIGGIAAWVRKVPRRVYVVRGLRLESASGLLVMVLWLAERIAMSVATDVVFVSQSLAHEAGRRRLLNPRKSWVIGSGSSNGVDLRAVEQRIASVNSSILRSSLAIDSRDFIVGFVGRIAADKGLSTLVQAFSDSRIDERARLLCIGSIEDEKLASTVRAMGNKVRVVAWTDDIWGHLPAIDVLCLPSLREGFPNVVLEAAAAQIPAITTRATGAIDSVIDGRTGFLIDVGDSASLVEKINFLARSPSEVTRMGSAAKQRVADEFKPEEIWQGVAEVLEGTANPRSAARLAEISDDGGKG